MPAAAPKKILLVDESKFHFSALNHVAPLTVFDVVLLPSSIDPAIIARMREGGIKLELV